MDISTRHDLFRLGMDDTILEYFQLRGPYKLSNRKADYFSADFHVGEVNIMTSTMVTEREIGHLSNRLRDEAKLYHVRGKQAGEDLIEFLSQAALFEQHIRGLWWFRGYYRTKSIFQKAFALLRFWRYTWIVAVWRFVSFDANNPPGYPFGPPQLGVRDEDTRTQDS